MGFKERYSSLVRALDDVLPVIDWWYGRVPSDVVPESVTSYSGGREASASEKVDEGSLRLLHATSVHGIRCILGYGDRHSFRFIPPLPSGYSDIAACGRCGKRALIEPGGRTSPVPENSWGWSIGRALIAPLASLLLSISLLACTSERAVRLAAPTPVETQTAFASTERLTWVSHPWCPPPRGCLSISGWRVDDGVLLGALIVAYHYDPDWRPIARQAVKKVTSVRWGNLPEGVGGSYSAGTITVSNSLRAANTAELAATIVHEATHATQAPAKTPAECLANEMSAYAWEANYWSRVSHLSGRSFLAGGLNQIVSAWRNQDLRDFVLQQPLYHRQCLHGDLPRFELNPERGLSKWKQ